MKTQRFERWNDHSCKIRDNQNNVILSWDEIIDCLNQANNRIDKLQKRSRTLFLLEKVINETLPAEKQEELYNRLHLELIRDEND